MAIWNYRERGVVIRGVVIDNGMGLCNHGDVQLCVEGTVLEGFGHNAYKCFNSGCGYGSGLRQRWQSQGGPLHVTAM